MLLEYLPHANTSNVICASPKSGAPKKLLRAQEQSLLTDIKEAIDKRIENRIATARRFAVSFHW